ncbi:hypothetical protein [Hafnia alvei]
MFAALDAEFGFYLDSAARSQKRLVCQISDRSR